MLYAYDSGNLEIRRGGGSTRISGSFPYNSRAVLSDGGRRGRPKKEYFASHAFRHSVESEEQEIHLLVGHDFGKPLASKLSGSLRLTDTDDALHFEATLASQLLDTTHGRDVMNMLSAGVVGGISPGFRIPPERTVPNAERVFNEPPEEGTAVIREINDAILFEISLVTRPAYPATQVEARNWRTLPEPVEKAVRFIAQQRWR
jgi:HK97 family phage prohead protease